MGLVSVTKVLVALIAPTSVSYRVEDSASTVALDPSSDTGAQFRGGHAENQLVDINACEFKKTHDASHMDRFTVEANFLRTASQDPLWASLIPKYIRQENVGGHPFIVLYMVTCGFKRPIIADFKLGTQSWVPAFHDKPGADGKKRAKMDALDSASTTKTLGVRVTSIQIPPSTPTWVNASVPADAEYQVGGRAAVKKGLIMGSDQWKAGMNEEQFNQLLQAYLPTPALRAQFVKELQPYLDTFSVQKTYHFTGASLFVFYDGEGAGSSNPKLSMKLIDFPHTLGSPGDEYGELDMGVLKGLTTLRDAAKNAGTE
eukprot:CAMPEP_0172658146 /NCGR_PEP_ID=MMETSP1074-20121228/2588_1 /TAXON_ID=2916 /ORGANISM="Ceratium fusus, Strain PA161109" /LENGTH=314 /DNA_ID=CAMNT_0013473387 /DNA_START=85 /DNA_END=1029 /DNA_ORIENTATION=+